MQMFEQANISGLLTTAQAAEATGLTAHRIGCLARAGEIQAVKSGNTLLIDAQSLYSYALVNQGQGRPLETKTAFALLWRLSGLEADWLDYHQARRLEQKLESITPNQVVWQTRKRAQVVRYRASESFLLQLEQLLVLSGYSIKQESFNLMGDISKIEGYCLDAMRCKLEKKFFLQKDPSGNVAIHFTNWIPSIHSEEMPIAVTATDLAQSLDARERKAGITKLKELINDYRNV